MTDRDRLHRRRHWIVLALGLFACADRHAHHAVGMDPSPAQPADTAPGSDSSSDPTQPADAAPGLDLDSSPERRADAALDPEPDAALPTPPMRELTADELAWAAATDFEIVLEGTQCLGSCPEYKATLSSNGDLRFTGYQYTWKPGSYTLKRAAADAARLYMNMIQRGFLALRDRYSTVEDGCPSRFTDAPWSHFTLRAAGREKLVKYYKGCVGELDALDTLEAIERAIIETTMIEPFLEESDESCSARDAPGGSNLASSYVVRDAKDQPLGILHFAQTEWQSEQSWSVSTCDGQELASGERVSGWNCSGLLLPLDETPLAWPGLNAPQAAVVLDAAPGEPEDNIKNLTLRLHTFDTESMQRATLGMACN